MAGVIMKNCIFCKKEFETKTKRLCCTRSCAAKFSTEKKGGSAWKHEEIEYLEDNLGVLPFPVLVKSFKKGTCTFRTLKAFEDYFKNY